MGKGNFSRLTALDAYYDYGIECFDEDSQRGIPPFSSGWDDTEKDYVDEDTYWASLDSD